MNPHLTVKRTFRHCLYYSSHELDILACSSARNAGLPAAIKQQQQPAQQGWDADNQ
jgi:hypothetical protein